MKNRPAYTIDDLHWYAAMIEMDRREAAAKIAAKPPKGR